MDYQNPPEDFASFQTLSNHAIQNFELTKRTVIASGFLGLDSKAVNQYIALISQHRADNNGFDDPSGFVSTLDACVAQAYLNTPGQITLLDGSNVDRRTHALSTKKTIETLLAAADVYAIFCLPKSGLDPVPPHMQGVYRDNYSHQTTFHGYVTFNRSSDIRFGAVNYSDFDQQELAEMVHKAIDMLESHEPTIEFYEKWSIKIGDEIKDIDIEAARQLNPEALNKLISLNIVARRGGPEEYGFYKLFNPLREHHLKNFSVIEHPLAEKVRDLAKDNLEDNPLYLSLNSYYISSAVAEMDKMMAKSQEISTLPVYNRSFAANTHGINQALSKSRFDVDTLKQRLIEDMGDSPFRFAGRGGLGFEAPSLPPEERILLYITGVQHIVDDISAGKRLYNPESWGFIMTTKDAKIPGGDDHVPQISKVFMERRLLAMGELYLVPSNPFSLLPDFFVNRSGTEDDWERSIQRSSRMYGKSFLLLPHFIDEPYDPKTHPIDFKGKMTGYWLEVHNNVRNIPPERQYAIGN